MNEIIIDKEFQKLIPPLQDEEKIQLEENLIAEGCRDALVTWQGILLDGHNRYEICKRLKIPFRTLAVELPDRESAADWIDKNQLGRRNLNPDQISYLRGRRYNRMKRQGSRTDLTLGQNDTKLHTANKLSDEYGVSPATVKRDGKMAAFLDEHADEAQAVLQGKKKMSDVRREIKRTEIIEKLEAIEVKEAKAVQGIYDVLVIDPPWPMQKIERDVAPEQVILDYPTLDVFCQNIEHIADSYKNLELNCVAQESACGKDEEKYICKSIECVVGDIMENNTADDCHIWLWTTHKYLPDALILLEEWNTKYTCIFTWHKAGGFQPYGLPQYNCEFAIYARKGNPQFIDTKSFFVCFSADRTHHSEKPDAFYDVLRRVTAGRRLDVFSRRSIEGFDAWGNEI